MDHVVLDLNEDAAGRIPHDEIRHHVVNLQFANGPQGVTADAVQSRRGTKQAVRWRSPTSW